MSEQDCLRRFLFEDLNIRGEWVRLEKSWQFAKRFQTLVSDAVEEQLGQALAATTLLAATIKFNGAMIMQIQGNGALRALVAQCSHDRKIRGLVRSEQSVSETCLQDMVGKGRLVLTIESDVGEPYQGIVPVEQKHLADILQTYFAQSEQLQTRIWLFADKNHAAGLFLQELPSEQKNYADWERIEVLASTLTQQEILSLDADELLHRMFNQEQVRLYDPEPVTFQCNCSRQKIGGALLALGRQDIDAILLEQDVVEVACQFCGENYRFDKTDINNLFLMQGRDNALSPTKH